MGLTNLKEWVRQNETSKNGSRDIFEYNHLVSSLWTVLKKMLYQVVILRNICLIMKLHRHSDELRNLDRTTSQCSTISTTRLKPACWRCRLMVLVCLVALPSSYLAPCLAFPPRARAGPVHHIFPSSTCIQVSTRVFVTPTNHSTSTDPKVTTDHGRMLLPLFHRKYIFLRIIKLLYAHTCLISGGDVCLVAYI